MKIIKFFLLLISVMTFAFSINAQESKTDKEQEIKSQKIALKKILTS